MVKKDAWQVDPDIKVRLPVKEVKQSLYVPGQTRRAS